MPQVALPKSAAHPGHMETWLYRKAFRQGDRFGQDRPNAQSGLPSLREAVSFNTLAIQIVEMGRVPKKEGDKLISDKTVPEGNDYPVVVQIRSKKGAKPVNAKFNLNMTKCPSCPNAEYSCICEH